MGYSSASGQKLPTFNIFINTAQTDTKACSHQAEGKEESPLECRQTWEGGCFLMRFTPWDCYALLDVIGKAALQILKESGQNLTLTTMLLLAESTLTFQSPFARTIVSASR